MEYISVALILIITGLLLNHWQPPIRRQYQSMILAIVGIGLGYFTALGWMWGFIISGLVFYKGELLEEIRLVKDAAIQSKEEITDLTNEK